MKWYWKAPFVGFWLEGDRSDCNVTTLSTAPLPWRVCWHPEEERHKKHARKRKLTLLPFLCHLLPKTIRNTSSNLIMLSMLLKNFSSIPLPFILTLGDWKQLLQTTAALMRMQHQGCSSLICFIRVHKSLCAQRCAYTYGGRCSFANHALHPQKQGPNHCFWEGSPRWQLMINGCIIPGSVAARPRV